MTAQTPFSSPIIRLVTYSLGLIVCLNINYTEALSLKSPTNKIAVIGTTGKLARTTVEKLSSLDIPTKCLLRHPIPSSSDISNQQSSSFSQDYDDFQNATPSQIVAYLSSLPNVTMIQGDVTNIDSLHTLMEDCTAVLALQGPKPPQTPLWKNIFLPFLIKYSNPRHPYQINYVGVQNILTAAKQSTSIQRIVRITGKNEQPFSVFSILLNMLSNLAKGWNYEGEELLRQSCGRDGCTNASGETIGYTIIRPGVMKDKKLPLVKEKKMISLKDNGMDMKVTPVSYEQIADVCIECLDYPNTSKSTLTVMNVDEGMGYHDYSSVLPTVKADSRDFPKTLIEKHRTGARLGLSVLLAFVTLGANGVYLLLRSILSSIF